MPTFVVPSSFGVLREFNPCHAPDSGRFCDTPGGAAKGTEPYQRPTPIRPRDLDHAIELILKGEVVELPDVRRVNTVLTKLAAMAKDAEAKGEKAPTYDLCKVSVPGTNLFCGTRLHSTEYPQGVPRIEMPQFSGKAVPGSPADKLPKNANGSVDGAPAFIRHLTRLGIHATPGAIPASRLKVSQAQLKGEVVAGMMASTTYDPAKQPVFVSRDGYIIDGHHRVAAVVGRDASDGRLGQLKMNVVVVDAPIAEVLRLSIAWTKKFGIIGKAGGG